MKSDFDSMFKILISENEDLTTKQRIDRKLFFRLKLAKGKMRRELFEYASFVFSFKESYLKKRILPTATLLEKIKITKEEVNSIFEKTSAFYDKTDMAHFYYRQDRLQDFLDLMIQTHP